MSYSASFEGGLNTVHTVIPSGATGQVLVGAMPKRGKVVRVRVLGNAAQSFSIQCLHVGLGPGPQDFTAVEAIAWAGVSGARAGDDVTLLAESTRDLRALRLILADITGTLTAAIAVQVDFEPR